MAKEVAAAKSAGLPAYLQGKKKEVSIGNVDRSDLIIPRIKLLQSVSPELDANDNAKKGNFWHNVASENLGDSFRAIPIIMRKSWVLWAPRGDDRGVLARANDGVHWDQEPGMKFTVKPKNSPVDITYILGETVHERFNGAPALSEFGSSIPGDKNSPPAAALTYQFLWYLPDFPHLSPAVVINTRSSVKPAKGLLSKIDMRPEDHYAQAYSVGVTKQKNAANEEFYNYTFMADGYATEEEYEHCKALYEQFKEAGWRADDETEDTDGDGLDEDRPRGQRNSGAVSDKF